LSQVTFVFSNRVRSFERPLVAFVNLPFDTVTRRSPMKPMWTAVAIAITLGAYGAVRAQTQRVESNQSDPPTMTQLLQEVRALRLAIERSTVAGTRAQLLLGRLQMQEARMATLGHQVQEARSRLLDIQRNRENAMSEIKQMTDAVDRVTPDERRAIEERLEQMKRSIKDMQQRERDFQSEYDGLTQALSTDEARWVDFNQRLEDLERSLAVEKQ
jgi:chromosome segregation ATPase